MKNHALNVSLKRLVIYWF